MDKKALWKTYSDRNPSFEGGGNVTMSAAGLRKLFEQTWDHAHEQGVKNGRALEKMDQAVAETVTEKIMKKFTQSTP